MVIDTQGALKKPSTTSSLQHQPYNMNSQKVYYLGTSNSKCATMSTPPFYYHPISRMIPRNFICYFDDVVQETENSTAREHGEEVPMKRPDHEPNNDEGALPLAYSISKSSTSKGGNDPKQQSVSMIPVPEVNSNFTPTITGIHDNHPMSCIGSYDNNEVDDISLDLHNSHCSDGNKEEEHHTCASSMRKVDPMVLPLVSGEPNVSAPLLPHKCELQVPMAYAKATFINKTNNNIEWQASTETVPSKSPRPKPNVIIIGRGIEEDVKKERTPEVEDCCSHIRKDITNPYIQLMPTTQAWTLGQLDHLTMGGFTLELSITDDPNKDYEYGTMIQDTKKVANMQYEHVNSPRILFKPILSVPSMITIGGYPDFGKGRG